MYLLQYVWDIYDVTNFPLSVAQAQLKINGNPYYSIGYTKLFT